MGCTAFELGHDLDTARRSGESSRGPSGRAQLTTPSSAMQTADIGQEAQEERTCTTSMCIHLCPLSSNSSYLGILKALRCLHDPIDIQPCPARSQSTARAECERYMVPLPRNECMVQLHFAALGSHAPHHHLATCGSTVPLGVGMA